MKAKQNKYIDLNQFICDKRGRILWKENVGRTVEFFYNDKRHIAKILEYLRKDHIKIMVDDIILDDIRTSKLTELSFKDLFYTPCYFYNIGDIVNDLLILEQCIKKYNTSNKKAYRVKCLTDAYEFVINEYDLKNKHGCPVCSSTIVVKGINDIATTDPDLVKFFANKSEACEYSRSSDATVTVVCPDCGYQKTMRIADLTKCGHISCNKCSDGISYPNKFAYELFRQLSDQYNVYKCEYSPEWAKPYFYDNYIEFFNGKKIIVEMDGGYHYKTGKLSYKNDNIKNKLCAENNITMIRIDCNYKKIEDRFLYIKSNIEKILNDYFDLSKVDWGKCNIIGSSNYIKIVINYYNNNPKVSLNDIAYYFNIHIETLYRYLRMGEEMGLCKYIRNDAKRIKNSYPVAMYNLNGDLIGIFKSTRVIEESFPKNDFKRESIRQCIYKNKPYKDYIFKFVTYEEYQQAC